jgi:hypothetical protein
MAGSLLAIPGLAAAHTTESIAETGGMSVDLVLPGVGLVFNVLLDEFGNIDSVEVVDPTLDPAPESQAHRARFELDEDGTRISVSARKHKLRSKVKVATLEDLLGDHQWSAVLFPEASDAPTSVDFTIDMEAAGEPSITVTNIAGLPAGAVSEILSSDEDEDEVEVKIEFSLDGVTKTLKIEVEAEGDDDDKDEVGATLKIELRGKDRQRLEAVAADSLVGSHVWSGLLCDGTTVGVDYDIAAAGTVTIGDVRFDGETVSEGFRVKDRENGFMVRFGESRARLKVKLSQNDDGTWDLKVDSKTTEKCKHRDHDTGDEGRRKHEKRDRGDHEKDDD